MLNVIMLTVVMLNVVMLGVIVLSVMAPDVSPSTGNSGNPRFTSFQKCSVLVMAVKQLFPCQYSSELLIVSKPFRWSSNSGSCSNLTYYMIMNLDLVIDIRF